jgi:hypothetical protein
MQVLYIRLFYFVAMQLLSITYSTPQFKTKNVAGVTQIWDSWRKKWIVLTPEEWVRQNFIAYLTQVLQYPSGSIAVEKQIPLLERNKRFDIVVYKNGQPWLLVECKAPEIPLTPQVLEQALTYNVHLQVPFIVITNGEHTAGWQLTPTVRVLTTMPAY